MNLLAPLLRRLAPSRSRVVEVPVQPEPIAVEAIGRRSTGAVVECLDWGADPRGSCSRCPLHCGVFPVGASGRWRCFREVPGVEAS
jgi:hypothetical protein